MSTLSRFARKSTIRQQVSFTEESLTDDIGRSTATVALDNDDLSFKLYVISRRSRFRAGRLQDHCLGLQKQGAMPAVCMCVRVFTCVCV